MNSIKKTIVFYDTNMSFCNYGILVFGVFLYSIICFPKILIVAGILLAAALFITLVETVWKMVIKWANKT